MRKTLSGLPCAAAIVASCATSPTGTATQAPERPAAVAAVQSAPSAAPVAVDDSAPDTVDDNKNPLAEDDTGLAAIIGTPIGDSFGAGGLGLSGTGDPAGGSANGIGIGQIGTFGHGSGAETDSSYGSGSGQIRTPSATPQPPTLSGNLPPELIQRVIRRNMNRIKDCYEQELAKTPELKGRLSVRFLIGRNGSVMSINVASADPPMQSVAGCTVRILRTLHFPEPNGGVVSVTYPFIFRSDTGTTPSAADAGSASEAGATTDGSP